MKYKHYDKAFKEHAVNLWLASGKSAADMLVEGRVMVESKASQALVPANEVQLVNYLTATGIEIGLLLNFGAERLEFKRKNRTYRLKPLPNDFIL
ncbi:MAG TPA: GxxExxY protein [Verrucomicrobiae bacterium]